MFPNQTSITQNIPFKNKNNIRLFMKREDLLHPHISGNKYRKLKYNLTEAKTQKHHTLLTFGGAFSNHIAATAYAGKLYDFKTIGVIRGEELKTKITENPTLSFAKACGMTFYFVTREKYRLKDTATFKNELQKKFNSFYLVPEGGTNAMAIKGCEEILTQKDENYDYICVSVGTGGTISGIINSSLNHQKVIGFPALKGDFLTKDIRKFVQKKNWELITNYHFGGYAKVTPKLIQFINTFKVEYNIPLDGIYTGKLMFGIFDLVKNNFFKPNAKVLVIHTGGLQGITGMNLKLKSKGWPLIDTKTI